MESALFWHRLQFAFTITYHYLFLVTNAFMQHHVGYGPGPGDTIQVTDVWAFLLNPWAGVVFAHNMTAAVVTASFVVASVGAFYTLRGVHAEQARLYLKWGTS